MTMNVRRELCAVMVFAVVEKAGSIVMEDGEEVEEASHLGEGVEEGTRSMIGCFYEPVMERGI